MAGIIVKIVKIERSYVEFDNGMTLDSFHDQDCDEDHLLDFELINLRDIEDAEFDLDGDFFEPVPGYGIRLKPINAHPIPVPGYGYNNGHYSANLTLELAMGNKVIKSWDIEECQNING